MPSRVGGRTRGPVPPCYGLVMLSTKRRAPDFPRSRGGGAGNRNLACVSSCRSCSREARSRDDLCRLRVATSRLHVRRRRGASIAAESPLRTNPWALTSTATTRLSTCLQRPAGPGGQFHPRAPPPRPSTHGEAFSPWFHDHAAKLATPWLQGQEIAGQGRTVGAHDGRGRWPTRG